MTRVHKGDTIFKLKTYLAFTAIFAAASVLSAQQPDALPVVVNPNPLGLQARATVVSDTSGSLLIAWRDSSAFGDVVRIQGFDRLGHRSGRLYQASTQIYQGVAGAELAVNSNGQAVLCWEEDIDSFKRVVFRRLNMDGSPESDVLPLPGLSVLGGTQPTVAIDSLGNVNLAWTSQTDDNGRAIVGNFYTFRDSTGVPSSDTLVYGWSGSVLIADSEGDQDAPAMAVDRKGRLLIAWRDQRPDSAGIFCRAYTSRGGDLGTFRLNLSAPEEVAAMSEPAVSAAGLNSDSSTFMVSWVERDTLGAKRLMLSRVDFELLSVLPVVVVDSAQIILSRDALAFDKPAVSGNEDGKVALVWSEVEGGVSHLYSLLFELSNEIPPPVLPLSSSEPGYGVPAMQPAVSVAVDGSLALVWTDSSGSDPDLRMQRFNFLGEVEAPVFASPGSGSGDNRAVTFLGRQAGGYTMYWEYETGDTLRIYKIGYDSAGRPLAAPSALNQASASQRRPVSAENNSGLQALAWEEHSEGSYRVMLELLKIDGTVVREPYAVASTTTGHLGNLALAVNGDGRIALLWERWNQSSGAPDLILARLDSLGNSLGSQLTVATAAGGGGRLASAALAPDGNLMVAWRQGASGGDNARIVARVYSPTGTVVRDRIAVSRDTLEYIGTSSRPVVAASDSTGNFLVLWQEFFSNRNQLYYRLYASSGDSLQLGNGQWRARLSSAAALEDPDRAYNSAAAAVDSAGGYLVLWSEIDPTGGAGLFGARFDPYAQALGSEFQVPGVRTATLPVIRILDQRRVAVAWQDTTGSRISFLGVQLDFHTLLGRVLLASGSVSAQYLTVHAEGVMSDAVAAAADGSFRFPGLLGGSYRVWVSADGNEIPGSSTEIVLPSGSGAVVDMGIAADLRAVPAPVLPRAGMIELAQNVPNPFNPSTTVSFTLAGNSPAEVSLAVYDLRGALVRSLLSGIVEPGTQRLEWDGRDSRGRQASSGVYFLRLRAGDETRVRKMILLK